MANGIVIVGAGHGGTQVAASLRDEGYDGSVTLVSNESDFPYHKPPLSKEFLKAQDIAPQNLRSPAFYAANQIDLRLSTEVRALDKTTNRLIFADGSALNFDRLVVATGARPRRLEVIDRELGGVFSLRSVDDARRLRAALPVAERTVIVGGGFIGLEVAATLNSLGKQVTIVEAADRLLGRAVAPQVSDYIHESNQRSGVRVLMRTTVVRVEGGGTVSAVITDRGERLVCDLLIVTIGALPNVTVFEEAGIACDNGILVDAGLMTSREAVYAIGDCANYHHWQNDRRMRLESVQNATDQARHVAKATIGTTGGYRQVPWFWSDQGPLKLQMTGLSSGADFHIVSGFPEGDSFSIYHFRNEKLQAVDSVNRPADHMLGRRMLAEGFTPSAEQISGGVQALKAALTEWQQNREPVFE